MALPTNSVWEVRPTAGNDTNGGGFIAGAAGTDFSQQNGKNTVGSNKSVTDGVGAGSTTIASASAGFTSAIVGNIVFFDSAWYQVVSLTNGTSVVVDRNTSSGTGLTLNIGGALATVSTAYANATQSNTIYVKGSGTYTVSATLTLTGANELPLTFIGYTTVRGDNGRVTWTTATDSTTLVKFGSPGTNFIFMNFAFTNTASVRATGFDGGLSGQSWGLRLSNCSFDGFTTAIGLGYINSVHYNLARLLMDGCEVKNSSSHGVNCSGGAHFIDCYIHDNGGHGVLASVVQSGTVVGNAIVLERCAIWGNTANGLYSEFGNGAQSQNSSWFHCIHCAIGGNGAQGIELTGSVSTNNYQPLTVTNSVIESNGSFAIINDSTDGLGVFFLKNNAFRANTSGNYSGTGLGSQASDITLTAECFTNPGSGDFTLNGSAGGGALLKAAGYPTILGSGTSTNLSIGPMQAAAAAAGAVIFVDMNSGMRG